MLPTPTPTTSNHSPSKKSTIIPSVSSPGSFLSTTPRMSSPLNPGNSLIAAPTALPEDDGDFPDSPVIKVTSSPTSRVSPLPGQQEGRLSSSQNRAQSRSPPGRVETPPSVPGQKVSPSTSWWGERTAHAKTRKDSPRKRRSMSAEEEEAWVDAKDRVSVAIKSVLGITLDVAHEALVLGSDFLDLAPIPGLATVAKTLLKIWDTMESVDVNTQACLRLIQRCAETLIDVGQKVHDAGVSVAQQLQVPLHKLQESFDGVRQLLVEKASPSRFSRFLKSDKIGRDIADCEKAVQAALDMFQLSVSFCILNQIQGPETKRQEVTQAVLAGSSNYQGQTINPPFRVCVRSMGEGRQNGVHSKFVLSGARLITETGVEEVYSLNGNSDVAMKSFHSHGAYDDPPKRELEGTYQSIDQFAGSDNFWGSIGNGKFYLRTDRGVVVKGEIIGGPLNGQSFTGRGTWLKD